MARGVLYSTRTDPVSAPWVTPHVRALAASTGVDLASVTGTGVGGRIRPADLPAAGTERAAARSVFTVEVDVTARGAGLARLIKAVVDAPQLADRPIVTRVDGRLAYLPGVRDRNEDGIEKLLADPASAKIDPARTLLVVTVPEALLAVPAWEGPVLALGSPVRRPAVVRLPGGGEGLGVRTLAHLTLSVDEYETDATAFLTAVASGLG
ncbi:E3 binding domain-containing protein [Cryptosporangium japonicum]|uniref:Peripheral subunit-binding (PSBD) domain-containing protein n=1 Tax=Cryptosporangium japonicum TaxID=80872 RepID=A0ABP3ES52_9ACTN